MHMDRRVTNTSKTSPRHWVSSAPQRGGKDKGAHVERTGDEGRGSKAMGDSLYL